MRHEASEHDPYRRAKPIPETFVERVAWALCAHDSAGGEGYLSDAELEGLEILLRKMGKTCGSVRAEADWLGIPAAAVKRHIDPLKRLATDERARRESDNPLMRAHLVAAYWPDYIKAAEAAFSVMLENPDIARLLAGEQQPQPGSE